MPRRARKLRKLPKVCGVDRSKLLAVYGTALEHPVPEVRSEAAGKQADEPEKAESTVKDGQPAGGPTLRFDCEYHHHRAEEIRRWSSEHDGTRKEWLEPLFLADGEAAARYTRYVDYDGTVRNPVAEALKGTYGVGQTGQIAITLKTHALYDMICGDPPALVWSLPRTNVLNRDTSRVGS